jgi:hypothetical protein
LSEHQASTAGDLPGRQSASEDTPRDGVLIFTPPKGRGIARVGGMLACILALVLPFILVLRVGINSHSLVFIGVMSLVCVATAILMILESKSRVEIGPTTLTYVTDGQSKTIDLRDVRAVTQSFVRGAPILVVEAEKKRIIIEVEFTVNVMVEIQKALVAQCKNLTAQPLMNVWKDREDAYNEAFAKLGPKHILILGLILIALPTLMMWLMGVTVFDILHTLVSVRDQTESLESVRQEGLCGLDSV